MKGDIRIIIEISEPDQITCASRAALWLLSKEESQRDAIIAYGDIEPKLHFYVRRTKTGISVRRCE